MKSFAENFYTGDYDQEMLDFIDKNYTIDFVNGWRIKESLSYHISDDDFFVSTDIKGAGKLLTKEQFKEKIGMTNKTHDEGVFTKNMLKDGMFVKMKGDIYMVLGKVLCSYDRYILLEDYDEGLNDNEQEVWNIQEVYILEGEDNIAPLNYSLSGNGLTSIWERPPEKSKAQFHYDKCKEKLEGIQKMMVALEKENLEVNS